MWFYTCYFLHIYLLLFDGIPFATTTLADSNWKFPRVKPPTGDNPLPPVPTPKPTPKSTTKPTVSVNPKDIWNALKEVTEGFINMDTKDRTPKYIFQPTSFLNPVYGVLFEHIGQ